MLDNISDCMKKIYTYSFVVNRLALWTAIYNKENFVKLLMLP